MERKQIGKSGLFVSELCLGCMTFGEPKLGKPGWTLSEEQSKPLIRQALDAGIDFLTSPMFTQTALQKRFLEGYYGNGLNGMRLS